MEYFFSKDFDVFNLSKVDYWRCQNCGFTSSRTHAEMTANEWESLNHDYHSAYQQKTDNPDDPRWTARLRIQAQVLSDAIQTNILTSSPNWLDYACGDGKLSALLAEEDIGLQKYDKFMSRREHYLKEDQLVPGGFDLVINTSVFEHFTRREEFDAVNSLVSDQGVLAVHTLVSEDVPDDSSWFYLIPVHCAFHTNKSMSILFEQWGYAVSIYHVDSRLWFWFKDASGVEEHVRAANERQNGIEYIFKKGFVDYWK